MLVLYANIMPNSVLILKAKRRLCLLVLNLYFSDISHTPQVIKAAGRPHDFAPAWTDADDLATDTIVSKFFPFTPLWTRLPARREASRALCRSFANSTVVPLEHRTSTHVRYTGWSYRHPYDYILLLVYDRFRWGPSPGYFTTT